MINYLSKFNYLSIKLIRSRIRSGQELGQVICQNCHKSTTIIAYPQYQIKPACISTSICPVKSRGKGEKKFIDVYDKFLANCSLMLH